jgi:hypothetical protein
VFYQNLILKENQKQPSKLISKGLILIFHKYTKTKTGNTYYFFCILDNDFYILVKRHQSTPHSQIWKVFLTFAVTLLLYCTLLYHDAPMDIRRRRSAFRVFNWKSVRKVKQFRNNRTMLVLKITIRLLVIYKSKNLGCKLLQGYTEWEI